MFLTDRKTHQPPGNAPRPEGGKHPQSWASRCPPGGAVPAFPHPAPCPPPTQLQQTSPALGLDQTTPGPFPQALPHVPSAVGSAPSLASTPLLLVPRGGVGAVAPPPRAVPELRSLVLGQRLHLLRCLWARAGKGGASPPSPRQYCCSLGLCFFFFLWVLFVFVKYTRIKIFKGEEK